VARSPFFTMSLKLFDGSALGLALQASLDEMIQV
jgi:hypothetical protein